MKVNGKTIELSSISAKNITEYLLSLKINPNTVAIEWNGEILDREKWTETALASNDQIEIIKFVGGG